MEIPATLLADPASAVRVLPSRRAGATGDHRQRGRIDAPHQGREAGARTEVRQARDGHRLARGPDRDADPADQRADRASTQPQARPLLASRAAQAGRPPPAVPELPSAEESRGLPRPHQGARPAPLAPTSHEGWTFERAPRPRGADSNIHPSLAQGGIEKEMRIVKADNPAGGPVSVAVEIGGREITFETGKLAKQADGAVVVSSGETVVLGTAQGRTEAREGADFFPLTVDVEERMYAAGKIPGGFFKREGRPTERAILTARMIDRPVRPLWPKGYRNEVQCVGTVFSVDLVIPHDILCINAVSAALTVPPLPVLGPIV